MKNRFKNEKGVISVFAMLAMLFFLLFILGAYLAVSRSNRTQKEANEEVLKLYASETNAQDVYDSMIATQYEVIPVYTYEQVNAIENDKLFWAINGKVYDFKSKIFKKFELKSNLNVPNKKNAHTHKYADYQFDRGEYNYVENLALKVSIDGSNNTGEGFSEKATAWTNLVSTDSGYFYAFDIFDGKKALSNGEINWTGDGLSLSGAGEYVLANNIMDSENAAQTLEIVFKTYSSNYQRLLGNWGNKAGGGLSLSDNKLLGEYYLEGDIRKSIVGDGGGDIPINQITHAAITYDGQTIGLYKNGEKISQSSGIKSNEANYTAEKTIKTLGSVSATVPNSSRSVTMKMKTYIGKSGESSANGITIAPNFVQDGNNIIPTFDQSNPSKIYVDYKEITDTEYYQNITDIKEEKNLEFSYNLIANQNKLNIVWEKENAIKLGIPNASEDSEGSFSIFCVGSDSVIIRSNIGKIQSWYFNDEVKLPAQNNGEVKILGTYYYAFDGLEPDTEYSIKAKFEYDGTQRKFIKPVEGKYKNSIFIGNSILNKYTVEDKEFFGGSFNGIVYAVRVYDKVLTTDQIRTNYKIDKSRFSIID